MINQERSIRRNFTVPVDLYARLTETAKRLSDEGIGRVCVSDLVVAGMKKVLEDLEKPLA